MPDLFFVHVVAASLKNGLWAPRITVVQQSRNAYKTLLLDMEEELFPSETAAVDYGIEYAIAELKKQYQDPEIRFTEKASGKEGKT